MIGRVPDWMLWFTAAAAAAGATYAGLTFHRDSAEASEVEWHVDVHERAVTLICRGPGVAYDVDIDIIEGESQVVDGVTPLHRDQVGKGKKIALGWLSPRSGFLAPGE